MKKILKIGIYFFLGIILLSVIIGLFTDTEKLKDNVAVEIKVHQDTLFKNSKQLFEEKNFVESYNRLVEIEKINKDSLIGGFRSFKKTVAKSILNKLTTLKNVTINSKNFIKKHDEFNKTTFYTPASGKGYGNKLYMYLGVNKNEVFNPRFVIQYYGNDWIFWEKAIFLIDDNTYNYIPNIRPTRDNNSKVWETSDQSLDSNIKFIINKVIKSKSSKYRLTGKYRYDRIITVKQKRDLKITMELFENFKNYFKLKKFCLENNIK